jgi:hypothetical protein
MQILDKKLDRKVSAVSKKLGLKKRDFVNASVIAYLKEFQSVTSLEKELDMWNLLSAISFRKNSF